MAGEQQTIKQKKAQCKKAGAAYAKMMKPFEKGKFPTEFAESSEKKFLLEYKDVIEDYLQDEDLKKEAVSSDFQSLVEAYQNHGGAEMSDNQKMEFGGVSNLVRDKMEQNGDEQQEAESGEGSSEVSGAQKEGLKDISKWLLRNMNKTGMFGDSRMQFVQNYVLRQPARVKLCAYYLVETDARKLSGDNLYEAVKASQQPSYVPNLERFKSKMIATKFKVWKRINADQFYWEKLSQSMRCAVEQSHAIFRFGNAGDSEVNESDAKDTEQASSPKTENKTSGSGAGTPKNENSKFVNDLYQEFQQLEKEILVQMKEKETLNAQGKWGEDKNKALEEKIDNYAALAMEITKRFKAGEESAGEYATEDGKLDEPSEWIERIGETAPGKVGDALGSVAEKLGDEKAPQLSQDIGRWTGLVGNGFSSISGIVSFGLLIKDIVQMARKNAYVSSSTKMEEAADVIQNLIEKASDALDLYKGFKEIDDKSTFATQSAGIAGMVTGSVSVAVGATKMVTAGVQRSHLTNASNAIGENKDLSENDRKKAQQAAELRKKILQKKQMSAGFDMAVGGLNVAAGALTFTGVGTVAVPFLEAAATGVSLISSLSDFIASKLIVKKAIDVYIDMDNIFKAVQEYLLNQQKKTGGKMPSDGKIKEYIRLEAAAQMGCSSINEFYNYVTRQYAILIHDKAMLDKNGNPIKVGKDGKPIDLSQTNKDFAELLKGFGLKANYKKQKPTINTIQKRMSM